MTEEDLKKYKDYLDKLKSIPAEVKEKYARVGGLYELDGAKVTETYSTYSQADKKWKFSYASTSFYTLPETGIVTVNGEGLTVKGRKIFRDGQVLIERGGVIYDLKGQVIK